MPQKKHDIWNHFEKYPNKRGGQCKHCKTNPKHLQTTEINRLIKHILSAACEAPSEIKNRYRDQLNRKRSLFVQDPNSEANSEKKKKSMDIFVDEGVNKQDYFDRLFARVVYQNALPLAVSESESLKDLFQCIRPSYHPPSMKQLRTSLLDKEYSELYNALFDQYSGLKPLALVSEGWSNKRGDHLVNYVVISPDIPRPFFLKSVCIKHASQTKEAIANDIIQVMNEFGIDKFSSVVTDNAPAMQDAWKIIENEYPAIFVGGCAADGLNLLLQDILSVKKFRNILRKCSLISKYIKDKAFRDLLKNGNDDNSAVSELLDATIWSSHLNSMNYVLQSRTLIENIRRNSTIVRSQKNKNARRKFIDIVEQPRFWQGLKFLVEMLKPIAEYIGILKGDDILISHVYCSFLDMLQHFEKPKYAKYKDEIQKIIVARWNSIHTDCMGVGYLLEPRNYAGKYMYGDDQASAIQNLHAYILKAGKSIFIDSSSADAEVTSFLLYASSPPSKDMHLIDNYNARDWWRIIGPAKFPNLSVVARNIYCTPASCAAGTRVWSDFEFIYTKKKNQLSFETTHKIAFVHANSRTYIKKTTKKNYGLEIGKKERVEGIHHDDTGKEIGYDFEFSENEKSGEETNDVSDSTSESSDG